MSTDRNYMEGRLPANAPLANPYVPFQFENPPQYEPAMALVRGTLFPGLDLPFMGMVNKDEKPATTLSALQAAAFVLHDMALYLDTHRDDTEALEVYRQFQRMNQQAMMQYEKEHGPLNHKSLSEGPYRWLDDPWPWEYARNCEV